MEPLEEKSPLAKAYELLFKWGREASPEIQARAAAVETERRQRAVREWLEEDFESWFSKWGVYGIAALAEELRSGDLDKWELVRPSRLMETLEDRRASFIGQQIIEELKQKMDAIEQSRREEAEE